MERKCEDHFSELAWLLWSRQTKEIRGKIQASGGIRTHDLWFTTGLKLMTKQGNRAFQKLEISPQSLVSFVSKHFHTNGWCKWFILQYLECEIVMLTSFISWEISKHPLVWFCSYMLWPAIVAPYNITSGQYSWIRLWLLLILMISTILIGY